MTTQDFKLVSVVLAASLLVACGKKEAPAGEAAAPASTVAAAFAAVDGARIINADAEPGAWLSHGRTYSEQRFSPLEKINLDNVDELGLAWHYKLDVDRATEATPIIVDGVMYVTGAFSIIASMLNSTVAAASAIMRCSPATPASCSRCGPRPPSRIPSATSMTLHPGANPAPGSRQRCVRSNCSPTVAASRWTGSTPSSAARSRVTPRGRGWRPTGPGSSGSVRACGASTIGRG